MTSTPVPSSSPASATPGRLTAVVVTFNRRTLLDRLVRALRDTSGIDEILVVDNASTDGTAALLTAFADDTDAKIPVHVLTLADNSGGAGGFHAGLAAAMDRGADLFWLMDDDGLPEPDCLDTLRSAMTAGGYDFVGPLVVDENDPSTLCFPMRMPSRAAVVRTVDEANRAARDGVIDDVVIPFNGVVVTRDLVSRIGLPRSEFFIWGDDVEYLWRARRAGAKVATVTAGRLRHPATDDLGTPMIYGLTTYNHSPSALKHFCMVRNNVVNLRDYRGLWGVAAFGVKTLWFYSFTHPDARRLRLSARAARAGWSGDFAGHREFLR